MDRLKSEDQRNVKISRNFQWLMWILVPLYLWIFILSPDADMKLIDRVGGACYVAAFIIFALIFRNMNKKYKTIDYSLPTVEMLKKAAERYKLFYGKSKYVVFPVLLIGVGVTLFFYNRLVEYTPVNRILIVMGPYLVAMAISVSIGILIWWKRQKPLREQALALIREIES